MKNFSKHLINIFQCSTTKKNFIRDLPEEYFTNEFVDNISDNFSNLLISIPAKRHTKKSFLKLCDILIYIPLEIYNQRGIKKVKLIFEYSCNNIFSKKEKKKLFSQYFNKNSKFFICIPEQYITNRLKNKYFKNEGISSLYHFNSITPEIDKHLITYLKKSEDERVNSIICSIKNKSEELENMIIKKSWVNILETKIKYPSSRKIAIKQNITSINYCDKIDAEDMKIAYSKSKNPWKYIKRSVIKKMDKDLLIEGKLKNMIDIDCVDN